MCRWIAYRGEPVFLEEFVARPRQSLIAQSRHSLESISEINGDGFGLGWYGERERPGVYRDIRPAWGDDNLLSIAHQIRSPAFLAHVRASTGTATTRANCHPFAHGRWLFMHNGQIGGYDRLRRRLDMSIPDALYAHRHGNTDSEALFLLMVANGLDADPVGAAARTLGAVSRMMMEAETTEPLRVTAALTDGDRLYAIRYASDGRPPTLYTKDCHDVAGTLVVSEPLDAVRDGWNAVPEQSVVVVGRNGVERREAFAAA